MKKKILILTFALMIGLMGLTGCTEEKKAGSILNQSQIASPLRGKVLPL